MRTDVTAHGEFKLLNNLLGRVTLDFFLSLPISTILNPTNSRHALPFKMSVEVITTISPTTNEPIISRNGASASELQDLPETSAQAFESWRKTSLVDRQIIVKKALKLLGDKKDELANEITVQMGRPIRYTGVEVTTAVKRGDYLVKISEDTLKDTPGEEEKGFKRFIRKVPVGPVLVVFPWNVSRSL